MQGRYAILTAVMALSLGTAILAISHGLNKSKGTEEGAMLSKEQENGKTILTIFRAIEERNDAQFRSLLQPDFEIHWPRSLPYGGTFRGLEPRPHGWGATWQWGWPDLMYVGMILVSLLGFAYVVHQR